MTNLYRYDPIKKKVRRLLNRSPFTNTEPNKESELKPIQDDEIYECQATQCQYKLHWIRLRRKLGLK